MSYSTIGVVTEVLGVGSTKQCLKIDPVADYAFKHDKKSYSIWVDASGSRVAVYAVEAAGTEYKATKTNFGSLADLKGKRVRLHTAAPAATIPVLTAIDVI